jgi:hypothetical protein
MTLLPGASGYFSRPQLILDPQLFEGTVLHPHVRQKLLGLFYDHASHMFKHPDKWSMLWVVGSGISFQWSGDRGNGDLDVLLGIDYNHFIKDNPEYGYYDRATIAGAITGNLRKHLWKETSSITFGPNEHPYEVTYYLNPGVEDYDESIKNINPYAAYNLTENHWTVHPMKPEEYGKPVPNDYIQQVQSNKELASRLAERYNYLTNQLSSMHPYSPQWHNLDSSKRLLIQHIKTMYDSIHLGRKAAFSQQGEGYSDFYNYQWQAAKRDGIVRTFNEILNREENNEALQ